jgi:hypothetical protein
MSAKLKVRVRVVGDHFGCVGEVLRRGRVIAQTPVYPYGFTANAKAAAEALAREVES